MGRSETRLPELRAVLYELKMSAGLPATLRKSTYNGTDRITGDKDVEVTTYVVDKLVLLPERQQYTIADGALKYGGLVESGVREAIVDRRDINVDICVDDRWLINGLVYNVTFVMPLDNKQGYYMKLANVQETTT